MKPVLINGDLWTIERVSPANPLLIDRTGKLNIAVADGILHEIKISRNIMPPLLDKVVLHELAHAITMSYGLIDYMRSYVPEDYWIFVEEWSAKLIENHANEAIALASEALGRSIYSSNFLHQT